MIEIKQDGLVTRVLISVALALFLCGIHVPRATYAQGADCNEKHLRDLKIAILNCEGDQNNTCTIGEGGPITLSASENIPEPHKSVFERAATRFAVNPNLLAALFLSEQGNVWKPFDSPWASSSAGASGPFQFMPGTWSAYREDGNGDGVIDIMNFEDAAYAAAKLAATGTNQNTPLGDLSKPFVPGTMIYFSAAYNWGGGNLQRRTTANSPITAAPRETQNYMNNIHVLLSSNFTRSGHTNYGPPRLPGSPTNQAQGADSPPTENTCTSTGANTELAANDAAAARQIISSSTNIRWGNYGSATSQRQDVENCLTPTTLIGLATMAQNAGVPIPINALATDHGGCNGSTGSLHNQGRGIDLGYYGNNSAGADRHKPEGDTLYKFLYDNREILQIDELIWQYPPAGYLCMDEGAVGECDRIYSAGTMREHYHHIHVGFKS